MSRLTRFAALSPQERRLLLRAFLLVAAIRAGLCLLPFRWMQRLTSSAVRADSAVNSVAQCVRAVRAASRLVPRASCLTQALAAQMLLARSGYDSRIEIGVTKDKQRGFRAHAWVVCADEVVIGGADAESYVPLTAWNTTTGRSR